MFVQEDVLKLCEILLNRIGVSSVLILQESLAGSFGKRKKPFILHLYSLLTFLLIGVGKSQMCIVDIGSKKTRSHKPCIYFKYSTFSFNIIYSVCCVEDGISIPSTRITSSLGSEMIDQVLVALFRFFFLLFFFCFFFWFLIFFLFSQIW